MLPEINTQDRVSKSKLDLDLTKPEPSACPKGHSSAYELQKVDIYLENEDSTLTKPHSKGYVERGDNKGPDYMTTIIDEEIGPSDSGNSVNDGNDESLYPDSGWRAYTVVFGSFLCCFTLFGIMNSIGAVESYVQNNQLKDDSVSSVSWIFSLFMFVSLFLGLFVGPLYDSFGSTWLLLAGSTFTFVGLFTCGACTSIYQFILSFGVCTGIGTGLMMFPAISAISSWFSNRKRSFALGVAQSGGSVGGVCFPILLRYLYPKYGFNWAMRILAFLNLGVDIVGSILAKDRLAEIWKITGEVDNRSMWQKIKSSVDLKAFKEKQFFCLSSALFMNEFSLLIVLTYVSTYAMIHGISQEESYNMLTILNAVGFLGKFIPSYYATRFGNFNMMILMSFMLTISMAIVWLPFGKYRAALYVFVCLFGFGCAAVYALTGATISTITKKTKDWGKRYGAAYAFVSFGNLVSLPISGSFIHHKTASDYDKMVLFAACTSLCATLLFILTRHTIVGRKVRVVI